MIRKLLYLAAAPAVVLCLAAPMSAGIVYTDLGSPNPFDPYNGTLVSNTHGLAFSFVPSASGILSRIDLGLEYAFSGANTATIELLSGSSGPGTVLESWTINSLPRFGTCCNLTTVLGDGSVALNSGQTYFLAVLAGGSLAWNWNNTGVHGTEWTSSGSGWSSFTGQTYSAFAVYATPEAVESAVPEPATYLLTAGALFGLVGLRRRLSRRG